MKEACPGEITLSIGDGGNDVPMINEAHVGVGIYGKEGMQAAQASDYAIGEFQCLWNLLMIHGRLAYLRIAELILYFFYKNAVFTLPQLYFAFFSFYSGVSFYDSWYISLYNLLFNSLPLLFKALFEHDIHHIQDRKLPLNRIYPHMYHIGQCNEIFNVKNLLIWFLYGIFHSCIAFFIPLLTLHEGILTSDGNTASQWVFSVTSFTCVIGIVNMKLFTIHRFFTWINALSILLLSLGIYIVVQWLSNYIYPFVTIGSVLIEYQSASYYLSVTLCVLITFVTDHFIELWKFHISQNASDFCRMWAQTYDPLDEDTNRTKLLKLQTLDAISRHEKMEE